MLEYLKGKPVEAMMKSEASPANSGSFCDVRYLYYDGHVAENASVMTLSSLKV